MKDQTQKSLSEVNASIDTTRSQSRIKKLLAFMGPAFLISVGYMDPGNWATDLAGGSQFGYTLLWVLLMSNIMAVLLQSLASRLGIVRGRDLAQACHESYPLLVNYALYFLAEIAIIATDLAEVIGMAIGLNLLFGIPVIWGILITFLDTFILLFLINKGMRKMEAFILALVLLIGVSFFVELFIAGPDPGSILKGFIPSIPDKDALYIALGIIGATVMPHNLYLHSSLVQTRKFIQQSKSIKQAIKFNFIDSVVALNLAFLVNAAILILAAATFYKAGLFDVAEIQDAYKLLEPLLGSKWAPVLFAVALIAAGQSSTITGTLAGQIIMEGFINFRMQPWVRRIITRLFAIAPAIAVVMIYGENYTGKLLIFSQVVLSLQLGFAVIPLIHFVSDSQMMGEFVIGIKTKILSWTIAFVIIVLNAWLVVNEVLLRMESNAISWWMILILMALLLMVFTLLSYIIFVPFIKKSVLRELALHQQDDIKADFKRPEYKKVAIALDFSVVDNEVLRHALALGNFDSQFLLIHVVESAPALYHRHETADFETEKDSEILNRYAEKLMNAGYDVTTRIGYGNPKIAISAIVNDFDADVLVLGSHGHKLLKDLIFGTTVNSVRHRVNIPVFVVQKN
jgi:manganese transport protein